MFFNCFYKKTVFNDSTKTMAPCVSIVFKSYNLINIYSSFRCMYIVNALNFNIEWCYCNESSVAEDQDLFVRYIDCVISNHEYPLEIKLLTNFGTKPLDYNKENLIELLNFMNAINHVWK